VDLFGKFPNRIRHIIDLPGHKKLRFHVHDYLKIAKCILFLVDAVDFDRRVRENGE
jgi:signal recognition particle receptor subunit beta